MLGAYIHKIGLLHTIKNISQRSSAETSVSEKYSKKKRNKFSYFEFNQLSKIKIENK